MMELVKRLRENRGSTYTTDSTMRSIQVSTPTTLDLEAATAIEELCERLESCWEKHDAAIAQEREACAILTEQSYLGQDNANRHAYILEIASAIRARSAPPSEVANGN